MVRLQPRAIELGKRALDDAGPQGAVVRTDEDQTIVAVLGEVPDVRAKALRDQLGEDDCPLAGGGLGFGEDQALTGDSDQLPFDPHRSGVEVDVPPSQRGQLTPSQTAESSEEHQGTEPRFDRGGLACPNGAHLADPDRVRQPVGVAVDVRSDAHPVELDRRERHPRHRGRRNWLNRGQDLHRHRLL
ncbi:hypothetical protein [Microtetraspora malaysiensis]|uniref:hypothetical protein n=1 Tax=Microtetraspora malaysiensis TaxID=161358 RepID=UPI003D8B9C4D